MNLYIRNSLKPLQVAIIMAISSATSAQTERSMVLVEDSLTQSESNYTQTNDGRPPLFYENRGWHIGYICGLLRSQLAYAGTKLTF